MWDCGSIFKQLHGLSLRNGQIWLLHTCWSRYILLSAAMIFCSIDVIISRLNLLYVHGMLSICKLVTCLESKDFNALPPFSLFCFFRRCCLLSYTAMWSCVPSASSDVFVTHEFSPSLFVPASGGSTKLRHPSNKRVLAIWGLQFRVLLFSIELPNY